MAIFNSEVMEKVNAMGGTWIKAPEFDGEGLVLQIQSVDKIKSQYGAKADDGMVERDILEEGETFRYVFKDIGGVERKHDSSSFPLFIAMQNAEFNFGDWLHIKREGKTDKTRYTAEKVEEPVSQEKAPVEYPENDIKPEDIPF